MDIISVKNLSFKTLKKEILRNLNFSIKKSSITAFIGSNGAGKTTTIRCMLGLNPIFKGQVLINNIDSKKASSRDSIGYVPEKENFPWIKVTTFLKDIEEIFKIDKKTFNSRLHDIAKTLNCEQLLNKNLHSLSSGEKKKIMIIQALLHDSDLLIMDEPTENMDPESRIQFYKLIIGQYKKGKTIFISTHQLDEISKYATDVVVIKNGEIQLQTTFKKGMNLYKIYESK